MSTIKKGRYLRVYVGTGEGAAAPIACATDCTFTINPQFEEVDHKDIDGNVKDKDFTGYTWQMQTNGLMAAGSDGRESPVTILDIAKTGAVVKAQWTEVATVAGAASRKLSGSAVITSYSEAAPVNGKATYSITFEGVGELEDA